jgi:hypothetical protein
MSPTAARRYNGILGAEETNSMELPAFHLLVFFTVSEGEGGAFFVFSYRDVYEFVLLCQSIHSNGPVIVGAVLGTFEETDIQRTVHRDISL